MVELKFKIKHGAIFMLFTHLQPTISTSLLEILKNVLKLIAMRFLFYSKNTAFLYELLSMPSRTTYRFSLPLTYSKYQATYKLKYVFHWLLAV